MSKRHRRLLRHDSPVLSPMRIGLMWCYATPRVRRLLLKQRRRVVFDWRYSVRIANIPAPQGDAHDLVEKMIAALEDMPPPIERSFMGIPIRRSGNE